MTKIVNTLMLWNLSTYGIYILISYLKLVGRVVIAIRVGVTCRGAASVTRNRLGYVNIVTVGPLVRPVCAHIPLAAKT